MADNKLPDDKQFQSHEKTYGGFMALIKWGTIITVIATGFVIYILVN